MTPEELMTVQQIIVATVAVVPATIAATYAYKNAKSVKTNSTKTIGEHVENAENIITSSARATAIALMEAKEERVRVAHDLNEDRAQIKKAAKDLEEARFRVAAELKDMEISRIRIAQEIGALVLLREKCIINQEEYKNELRKN